MLIKVPNLSLIVLIGPSGSGKSAFARKHFRSTEVVSSDACRALISDDENDQGVTVEAFDLLHTIAAKRLALGRLTVIDATNVQPEARRPLVEVARRYHCVPVAIVLNLPEKTCHERNRSRADRSFGPHLLRHQISQLRRSLAKLKREGFRYVYELTTVDEIEAAAIERMPLWTDKRNQHGPFDIIGDVHGCCDELEELLRQLGYQAVSVESSEPLWGEVAYAHPNGRKAVFLGDLMDRGPRNLDVARIVRHMVRIGSAFCVPGNHDMKLLKKLQGKQVQITHGLAQTLSEIDRVPDDQRDRFCEQLAEFLDSLISHYVLDDGKLVVAHAGMKREMQGRASSRVRDFALYGETTGETDEFGLPVRFNWAAEYRGTATVVYGHTPVPEAEWLNRTVNIDTGCVFGGKLTALRYPELEFVSVAASHAYCEPARPFLDEHGPARKLTAQQVQDEMLDAEDVLGKRFITTRLQSSVTIREENATAALEVMSRFAVNPKWLIYLPPTMSPCETSKQESLLEYPVEAFSYYRSQGTPSVVCEQKHMGSRAVVIVCRDDQAASARFGIAGGETGIVYTRTGRRFFNEPALERAFLDRLRSSLTAAEIWDRFSTTWACLDCELMPWSAKAQELLRLQYAAVGAAGRTALPPAISLLEQAANRTNGSDKPAEDDLLRRMRERNEHIARYVDAYRHYCWPATSVDDLKLAPFHLLATENNVHVDQNHLWHMTTLSSVCQHDPQFLVATPYRAIDLMDPQSERAGVDWWLELTKRGDEGMVIKPLDFISRGKRGLVQPALKCRGREYLRIIYGPEYTSSENLCRLRSRRLGAKRSLALREFALGIEALERFVRKEPLRRVHECVFGVLGLESEPVDPRL